MFDYKFDDYSTLKYAIEFDDGDYEIDMYKTNFLPLY